MRTDEAAARRASVLAVTLGDERKQIEITSSQPPPPGLAGLAIQTRIPIAPDLLRALDVPQADGTPWPIGDRDYLIAAIWRREAIGAEWRRDGDRLLYGEEDQDGIRHLLGPIDIEREDP